MNNKLLLPSKTLDLKLRLEEGVLVSKDYGMPVRIRNSVYKLLENVVKETGLTKVDVIEKLILFALDNVEYVTTLEYERDNIKK